MQKNKTKKKMKQSNKVSLTIALCCMALGLGFLIFGFLQGPSYWFGWDGHRFVSSNSVGIYTQQEELEPFSSIVLDVPAASYTIKEGKTFSISYRSNYPGIKPALRLEDGVLSYVTEGLEPLEVFGMEIQEVYGGMQENNCVEITVPAGTKLDSITFHRMQNSYCNYSAIAHVYLQDLQVGTLDWDTGSIPMMLHAENMQVDSAKITDFLSGNWDNVTAGTIALHDTGDMQGYYYVPEGITFTSVTADRITANDEQVNREGLLDPERMVDQYEDPWNQAISVGISKSQVRVLDLLAGDITLDSVTSEQVTALSTENIAVSYCSFSGATVLRARGEIDLKAMEAADAYSGMVVAGFGFRDALITEYAEFGTEAYNYGYVTNASKDYGVRTIQLSWEEYSAISQRFQPYDPEAYGENEETTVALFESGAEQMTEERYRDYVELSSDYDEEGSLIHYITVYNRKQVTYYINSDGRKVYVNDSAYATLTLNDSIQSGQRYTLPGSGTKTLDSYSRGNGRYQFN